VTLQGRVRAGEREHQQREAGGEASRERAHQQEERRGGGRRPDPEKEVDPLDRLADHGEGQRIGEVDARRLLVEGIPIGDLAREHALRDVRIAALVALERQREERRADQQERQRNHHEQAGRDLTRRRAGCLGHAFEAGAARGRSRAADGCTARSPRQSARGPPGATAC
jgi:hypothetical protein